MATKHQILFINECEKNHGKNAVLSWKKLTNISRSLGISAPNWLSSLEEMKVSRGVYKVPSIDFMRSYRESQFISSEEYSETTSEISLNISSEVPEIIESDNDILERICQRFDAIVSVVKGCAEGRIRSAFISGKPGISKSYSVMETLNKTIGKDNYVVVKGTSKATGLFKTLYNYRHENSVIVYDDCDTIFQDAIAINILKSVTDFGEKRSVSWLSESKFLDEDGEEIPSTFEFCGSIIFITNMDFDELIEAGSKLSPHLEAISSRSLYIDIGINTLRERLIWMKHIVNNSNILSKYDLYNDDIETIMDFIEENLEKFSDVSLRLCEKIAQIYKMDINKWENTIRISTFKKMYK